MADMSDAANGLVAEIAAILYPQGSGAPSLTGDRLLVYQGTPDAVTRTRLQLSQKLWVSGVMKPIRPPVSATRT